MPIDVVIVNWNSGDQVAACVDSLVEHDRGEISSIVVVDNDSFDGSADRIEQHKLVRVLRTGANLGFGRACNAGAALGSSEYILFLNPDCRVYAGSVVAPLAFLQSNERDYVAVGIRLVDESGRIQRHCARIPGPGTLMAEALGLTHIAPSIFRPVIMTDFSHERDVDVDHVIGAFYLVRRGAFESVGGFDERFFMYMEDLDLSARLAALGKRIRYLSEPSAFHQGGGTSSQILGRRLGYSMIARSIFSDIHFPRLTSGVVKALIATAEPVIRLLRAIPSIDPKAVGQVWEGTKIYWSWLSGRRKDPSR